MWLPVRSWVALSALVTLSTLSTLSTLGLAGCGSSSGPEAAPADGATDTGIDGGSDGGSDGRSDGRSDGGSDAADTADAAPCPSTSGALVDRLAAAVCDPLDDCCKKGGFPNDAAKCRAQVHSTLLGLFDRAMCDGSKIDAARLDACVTALHDYTAACRDRWDVYEQMNDVCDRAVTGLQEPGKPCGSTLDCVQPTGPGHTTCLSFSSSEPSECQEIDLVGAGGPCNDTSGHPPVRHECDASKGLVCDVSTCVAAPTSGKPCVGGVCAAGLVCVGGKECVVPAVDGGDCAGAPCAEDSRCAVGKCQKLADVGEACSANADCRPGLTSCVGGKCAPTSFITGVYAGSSTCRP